MPSLTTELLGRPVAITAPPALLGRLRSECGELLRPRESLRPDALILDHDGRVVGCPDVVGFSPLVAATSDDVTFDSTASENTTSDNTSDPLQLALANITRDAVERSPWLCIHAGVVAGSNRVIALPGGSGHGKSTLVAALLGAGFAYLSDEVLALEAGSVQPFPRPIGVDMCSWQLLGRNSRAAPPPGEERFIPATEYGPVACGAPLTDLLLTERIPGVAGASCIGGASGEAATALLRNAFNHYLDPAASFRTVCAVSRQVRVWRLRYSDAPEAAALLAERWL